MTNKTRRLTCIGLFIALLLPVSLSLATKTHGAGIMPATTSDPGKATPEVQWPHDGSDLDPSPGIVFGTLDNGIRYVLKENEHPEDRVSMHLNVHVGSFHENDDARGIAHYLEHMLFLGTENFDPGELVKYFQRIGMKFGPDVNAQTGFYNTIYHIDLPEGDRDHLSEGLLVLSDYAAGGLIPEEQVDSERSVILAEKRTRDSPAYRTFKETLKFEAPGTRITERLPIGTREVIEGADRDLLKNFYDTWYRPENLVVVMVGDFDAETAETLIENRFAGITAQTDEKPRPDFGDFAHEGVKPFYHHEPESGSTRVSIGVVKRKDQPEDSFEYRENRLLEQMANQAVNHRINNILNAPDAPFTSARSGSGYYFKHVRAAEIRATCEPEKWDQTLGVLEKTLRKALAHGFTEAETTRVKREFTAKLERDARAAPTRESQRIARQFLSELNTDRVLLLAQEKRDLFKPVIDGVTPEKLNNAFRDAWAPDHRLLQVSGNVEIADGNPSPEDQILAVYKESQTIDVEKPPEDDHASFPYLESPDKPGNIKEKEHIEDQDITRVVFENGTTLFVKQTDFKADEVLASLRFGEGRRAEPADQEGLSRISQRTVNLGGLGTLDREALRSALAGTSTSVSFSVESDAFLFSGTSVTDETQLLFELLYAHLKDPGYRESARERAIRQFEREYASLAYSIEGGFQLKGRRFLADGDTRFGLPDFDALVGNELTAIEAWIEDAKQSHPLEIAVVGDIDPEAVIELAARFFGNFPDKKDMGPGSRPESAMEKKDRFPVFPEKGRLAHEVPTRMERALLVVAYPATDRYDIEKTRRLSILSEIFSDRIRIKIRDDLGASYSQGAFSSLSRAYKGYGYLAAQASLDPADTEKIEREIKKIADDLRENGITEDELERAVKPVLAGITNQVQTNRYWLNTVLKGAARHPPQIDWSRTIFIDHASITTDEINRLAEKYFDNDVAATLRFFPGDTGENAEDAAEDSAGYGKPPAADEQGTDEKGER